MKPIYIKLAAAVYLVVLLFSLLLNAYFLYRQKGNLFIRTRKADQNTHVYAYERDKLFQKKALPNHSIVFIGDSYTQQFELNEYFENSKIRNRGIDGDDLPGVRNRIGHLLKTTPDKLFILAGINDVQKDRSNDEILISYRQLFKEIKLLSPKTEVFINSIFPVASHSEKFKVCSYETNQRISILNKRLKEITKENGFTFIDTHSYFTNKIEIKPQYRIGDGLHLSAQGYELWASLLRPHLP